MEHLRAHAELATVHVHTILKMERAAPFTQNTHYYSDKRDKLLARYRGERGCTAVSLVSTPGKRKALQDALAARARLGYNVKEDDLPKLNPHDEFEEELEMMAEVRAYFQVAYKVRTRPRRPARRWICSSC